MLYIWLRCPMCHVPAYMTHLHSALLRGVPSIGGYDTTTRRFSMRAMQKKGAVRPYPPLSVFICARLLWEEVIHSTELCTLCQLQAFFSPGAGKCAAQPPLRRWVHGRESLCVLLLRVPPRRGCIRLDIARWRRLLKNL